jgi:hypothetical protein
VPLAAQFDVEHDEVIALPLDRSGGFVMREPLFDAIQPRNWPLVGTSSSMSATFTNPLSDFRIVPS